MKQTAHSLFRRILACLLMLALIFPALTMSTLESAQAATTCTHCKGKGEVTCSNCGGSGRASGSVSGSCYKCHGSGYTSCSYCGGTGKLGADLGGGSGSGGSGGSSTSSISLSATSLSLVVGHKGTLKVNGTTKTVTWKSSNTAVATVSAKGVITPKKVGTAKITATVAGKTLSCSLKVTAKVYASKVKLSKTSAQLMPGYTLTLGTTVSPAASKITEAYTLTWKSSNTAVATVTSKGVVKAKAAGTAKITVTLKSSGQTAKTATCTVVVKTGKTRFTSYMAKKPLVSGARTYTSGNVSVLRNSKNMIFVSDEGYVKTTITFPNSMTGTATVTYEYSSRFGTGLRVNATTKINIAKITKNGAYTWTHTTDYKKDDMANAAVNALLSAVNVMVKDAIGGTLKDIGFTKYK